MKPPARPKAPAKETRPRAVRQPDIVAEVRLGVLEDLVVQGMPWEDVVALLTQPPPIGFGVTEDTLDGWARKIRARWRAEGGQNRDVLKAEHRARLAFMFRRSVARDGVMADKVALDAAKLWAQVDGVLQPGSVVVNNNQTLNVGALTPLQRQQEIDQLLAKREQALASRGGKSLPSPAIIEATAAERR